MYFNQTSAEIQFVKELKKISLEKYIFNELKNYLQIIKTILKKISDIKKILNNFSRLLILKFLFFFDMLKLNLCFFSDN